MLQPPDSLALFRPAYRVNRAAINRFLNFIFRRTGWIYDSRKTIVIQCKNFWTHINTSAASGA